MHSKTRAVVVPAKGTSNRVHNKNLQEITPGVSLVQLAVTKLLVANVFDAIYIDTECDLVWDSVKHLQCKLMKRPVSLANNLIDGNGLLRWEHGAGLKEYETMFQFHCTSPLILPSTIAAAVSEFIVSDHDSMLTVVTKQEYNWINGKPNYDLDDVPNGVDMPVVLQESHALYGIQTKIFEKLRRRIGNNPLFYKVSEVESYDVNTQDDLRIVQTLAEHLRRDNL